MTLQTPPRSPGAPDVPGRSGAPRSRPIQALVVVAAILLLVGITLVVARLTTGGEDSEPFPQASVTTVASVASPTVSPEQAVLDAYYRSERASLEAGSSVDPASPALVAAYTGEALREARAGIAGLKANGLVVKGSYDTTQARVLSINGTTATVRATGCDRSFKHDAKTGQLRDSPRVVRFDEEVTLVFVDGTWKVSKIVGETAGECAP